MKILRIALPWTLTAALASQANNLTANPTRITVDYTKVSTAPPKDTEAEPIQPIPTHSEMVEELEIEFHPQRAQLGDLLFHDTRLSTDNTLSCASCHDLRYGGIDRAPTATGIQGQRGPVNTPTVFNSVFNVAQFWDGRAADLKEQAGGPPLARGEMGSTWPEILEKLRADQNLVTRFQAAFGNAIKGPQDITHDHILESIAQFEVTLTTPDGRFDLWLKGDAKAMTRQEVEGYELFKQVGCATCHYGIHAGGRTFQRLGAKREFFTDANRISHVDHGRYNVTKDERDRHVFKVPSLRNVAITGPWFHDGSMTTLNAAVEAMALHQLDVALTPDQTTRIVAFLNTLTGQWRGHSLDRGTTTNH